LDCHEFTNEAAIFLNLFFNCHDNEFMRDDK